MAYWDVKPLSEMSRAEWEALCDGCARCCLVKLEDETSGKVFNSDVHCRLLDPDACKCADYAHRLKRVPECIKLEPDNVGAIDWIPPTCAYRRIAEGRGLAWWHPLVSGDPETVHQAGISIRGKTIGENQVPQGEWENHIVDWPADDPDAEDPDAESEAPAARSDPPRL